MSAAPCCWTCSPMWGWLANAYLTAGEVEQAAVTTGRALELSTGVASIRPRQRIAPLLDQLRPHADLSVVRNLLEHAAG
ncbi:hypothetical protein ACFYWN_36805 [Streptomyces sp. NPDC002917]|uniref:hypothetical protein n=1 Tax=unclassified Streptomyces TaxID=2593676 RepID=UPI0036A9BFE3|nr:hypothetical protein OH719_02505 [Streptomyces sp. NBC_01653]WTD93925.1 hypothetical protein OG891_44355 [Streptomyces sp. NBC_01637]